MQDESAGFELSPRQQRVWQHMHTDAARAFRARGRVTIQGDYDLAALEHALNLVVARHEILRTRFAMLPGAALPLQCLDAAGQVAGAVFDLRALSAADRDVRLEALWHETATLPLDPSNSTVLHARLALLEPGRAELILTLTALCADRPTLDLLTAELAAAYDGSLSEQAPENGPMQYVDIATWHNELLRDEERTEGRDFWRDYSPQSVPSPRLPMEKVPAEGAVFAPDAVVITLSPALTSQLERRVAELDGNLATGLLACWHLFLHRLSGAPHLVVGVDFDGRYYDELASALGPLSASLPIYSHFTDDISAAALVRALQEALEAVAPWQEYFTDVVGPDQRPLDMPWRFDFQGPTAMHQPHGRRVRLGYAEAHTDTFTLKLACHRDDEALVCTLFYDTARFDREAIQCRAAQWHTLLERFATHADASLATLSFLGDTEGARLLSVFAGTVGPTPQVSSIHALIEAQAARHPDHLAVVRADAPEPGLTYEALNRLANRLAHRLRARGVRPDVPVAVCLARGPEAVIGILAVLKAGGAYVPLEPDYPSERLAYLLDDSGAFIVLTHSALHDKLPPSGAELLNLDTLALWDEPDHNPAPVARGQNAAYIIYTSGSTGTPHGVVISHANLIHSTLARLDYYREPQTAFLLLSPLAFDSSIAGFYGALCDAATLVFPSHSLQQDPHYLASVIAAQGISHMLCLPSLYNHILDFGDLAALQRLQAVIVAGEACPAALIAKHRARLPHTGLYNEYGPTEATVWSTVYNLEHQPSTPVPIGHPIPGTRVYILDEHRRPTPIGVPGELYIGGPGVARGYHNCPALTAERFVDNPFVPEPEARLYRTGDLACFRTNGAIDFLGRVDQQVKIRGFRVELGEIEAVLSHHQAVHDAVVVAREEQPGLVRLAAYIVPADKAQVKAGTLLHYLQKRLPDYMVPTTCTVLDTLPLLPNGKIDRQALPVPQTWVETEPSYVPPETATEHLLAAIWAEVLHVPRVGRHDRFFTLGGDSILSIQILGHCRERGLALTLHAIAQNPTLQELAREVDNTTAAQEHLTSDLALPFDLVPPACRAELPDGLQDAYPLASLQTGMVFHGEFDPEATFYHDIVSLHLRLPCNAAALRQAVDDMAARHPVLRTSFMWLRGEGLQLVHQRVQVPLEIHDVRDEPPAQRERALSDLFASEKARGFDLTQAPLWRVFVHRYSADSFYLTVSEHHAILDGWSSATLMTELCQHYMALAGMPVPPLQPAPAISYAQFVALERQAQADEACRTYWEGRLADCEIAHLPRPDIAPEAGVHAHTARVVVPIAETVSASLKRLANETNTSVKCVLLAAHMKVLGMVTNQEDVLTGVVANGRVEAQDGDRTLGLFLNTMPCRLQLAEGTWRDLVSATAAHDQESLPYRRYPLADLQRSYGGQPLFETLFNYTHFHVYKDLLALEGLEVLDERFYVKITFTLRAQFSLDLNSGQVALHLDYDAATLTHAQVTAIGAHYAATLRAMAADPDALHHCFSAISSAERAHLLETWNATRQPRPEPDTVIDLFEARVRETPDATAAVFGGRVMTYLELDAAANRVANLLCAAGVTRGTMVGLWMERSCHALIAIWGVLKAGAAYVPIDLKSPDHRLQAILADSGLQYLLTRSGPFTTGRLPETYSGCVIAVDAPALDQHSATCPHVARQGAQPAYVIYTSGSTGTPKGVVVSHAGLLNYAVWARDYYLQDNLLAAFPLFTSLAFDLTVTSIFVPLISGGSVVIYGEDESTSDFAVVDVMHDNAVDIIKLTPSHMLLMLDMDVAPARLTTVILGGEELKTDLARAVLAKFGSAVAVYNEYGPTEAVVGCMIHRFDPATDTADAVPIGTPIANARVYLLDRWHNLVPVGTTGEMYLGGDSLALGYLHNEAMTHERFLPDPFNAGGRMYRTGDLARQRADGTLVFLGRADRQVKIRGNRIELGEIEAALAACPGISDCVVEVRDVFTAPDPDPVVRYCTACGLPDNYPGTTFDAAGVCNYCAEFAPYSAHARRYFRDMDAFRAIFADTAARRDGRYDCLFLLSGGKDSTYALYRLVDMGLRVLAMTLDNGYISDSAKANIRRVTEDLGVEHLFATTPSMDQIFADSLRRFSNVCNGCFKTIYTLAMQLAHTRGIRHIVTGLSRGQLFETRLAELYKHKIFDSAQADRMILEARKVYHRTDDAVLRLLDTSLFADDAVFEAIHIHDFYRYCDVELDEVYRFLREHTPWLKPADTGRSTNCLINNIGIYIHKKEQGYHNYALPYSWDVRLGHKTREAAIAEMNDDIDVVAVRRILNEIGYDENFKIKERMGKSLVAYYTGDKQYDSSELRHLLGHRLPDYMLPALYVKLPAMPLTANGKIDRPALPVPDTATRTLAHAYVAPRNPEEVVLAGIWADTLGLERVGVYDDFFALGGHSLMATHIIAQAEQHFNIALSLRDFFSEDPTIAGLARTIVRTRGSTAFEVAAWPTITPDPAHRYEPFPLTDIQQAYWIGRTGSIELSGVGTHGYAEQDSDDLDLARFAWAWHQVVHRHDMLRAVIMPDGRQRVLAEIPPYSITTLDLRGQPEADVQTALAAVRAEMSHQLLPTDRPLYDIRASLMDHGRVRLHISYDALVFDAWSVQLLSAELTRLYRDPAACLTPLTLSFRDYVLAQRALEQSALYQRDLAYWQQRVEALPPGPELPLACAPATLATPRFTRLRGTLSKAAWARLKHLGARFGLTPSAVLLSAFSEILSTWSKTAHYTLNLTLFNRLPMHPEVTHIVGDFTSLIMLEVKTVPGTTFKTRAMRIQKQLWHDLDHRLVSGVHVLRELRRAQGMDIGALMPVVFTSTLGLDAGGATDEATTALGRLVYSIGQTPQVWLDHQVGEENGALVYNWDMVEELFPAGLPEVMFAAYAALLDQLATDDAVWTAPHRVLLPEEQRQRRAEVNHTQGPAPNELLHQAFFRRALLHPERIAVATPDRTLTYGELYRLASYWGQRLRTLGAQPNQLVAVAMEKGWEQVVAVLGILASGAAYLPIDIDLPEDRRATLLSLGQVALVLTQEKWDTALTWPEGLTRLCVDTTGPDAADVEPPEPVQLPADLAYVIFTSGSTGEPKGVMLSHQAALNTVDDINERFQVSADDCVFGISSLSFDLSVYDIFGTLAAGAVLFLPRQDEMRDPAAWVTHLHTRAATVWNSVPMLFQMLVEYLEARPGAAPPGPRLVMMSGDWIPIGLPERIAHLYPQTQMYSLGGATEAAIWSIYYPIEAVHPAWTSIPYGKPLRNQGFHVYNEDLEACPDWVPGDLYISGMGLAEGYWGDAGKTRASFITHPRTGERLYRTGDLGRYWPDGTIEFLGRDDFQVKIKGHRLELGEIELALQKHASVKEVVVTAVGTSRENKELVAYVVPHHVQAGAPPWGSAEHTRDALAALERKLGQAARHPVDPDAPSVFLPTIEVDQAVIDAYMSRTSARQFGTAPPTLEQLTNLLAGLRQWQRENALLPKYRYPSAGDLYPVQTYVYAKPGRIDTLAAGVYYYDPREHELIRVSAGAEIGPHQYGDINRPIYEAAAFVLYLVGKLDAMQPLYGALTSDFCMLEAGYMGQLLMELAAECGLGLCPIGDVAFADLPGTLGVDPHHVLLHGFVGGGSTPERSIQEVQRTGYSTDADRLRAYLETKLPAYMVPRTFVFLDTLPLTANGKIDRKSLPVPAPDVSAATAYAAPRTPTEEAVTAVCAEILGRPQVGIADNFFELGGDSLLATRFVARLQQVFQVELSLRTLFAAADMRALTQAILAVCEEQGTHHSDLPVVVSNPARRHEPFPLTDVQYAYWVGRTGALDLGNVSTHSYLELDSLDLDTARFEAVWNRLIARHDMLRAVILPDGRQHILAELPPFTLEVLDVRGADAEAIQQALDAVRARMSHQVLPTDKPLYDIRATRLDDRTRLHISRDALITDAWSNEILAREFQLLYTDPEAILPPLDLAFRDYVVAMEGFRSSDTYRRSLAYWNARLATLPPGPDLPLMRDPAAIDVPHFERRSCTLPAERWNALKNKATHLGLTPSALLLAAFAEILGAWSSRPHFTLTLTLFNRFPIHPHVSDVVGDFTSLTLLEADLTTGAHFHARATNLQRQLIEDLDHRYVSGVHVMRELARLHGAASGIRMPVVFTSLLGLGADGMEAETHGVLGKTVYSITQTPQVWLDHQVGEFNGTLFFYWDSVATLFPDGVMDAMFDAYCLLLIDLAAGEVAWTDSAPAYLLAAQLQHRQAVNATAAPVPEGLLHQQFFTRAQAQGSHPAVISADRSCTYAELAHMARYWAARLREAGAAPGKLVGVVMEKGWEQVVAVLAILESGGAYLPIDPELPTERRHYLFAHGEVALVLTQSWLDRDLAWPTDVRRFTLDNTPIPDRPMPALTPVAAPTDLAYTIFTSGSTGLPKGVMIDHRGALNTIIDMNERCHIGPQAAVFALSALSFDLSVYDIFGALAAGATIVMPAQTELRDPTRWADLMRRHRVSVWNSVPALMQMLVEHLETDPGYPPAALHTCLLSGDWIPVTLPGRVKRLFPAVSVTSLGGATEASIWSIIHPIQAVDERQTSIPYGKPLTNQRFHVLDDRLAPCPTWVPGHLYIGGIGLAKGYWRDQDKTAAAFITHPQTGERLYRTGDLGRYLADGTIEFLGRDDFQVKIRGHRIELGEIEAILRQHPEVKDTVVAAVGEVREHRRLVAYVVPTQPVVADAVSVATDVLPRTDEAMLDSDGLLMTPEARLSFKLQQHGLRRHDDTDVRVALPDVPLDDTLRNAYVQRRSVRQYLQSPVPLDTLGCFMAVLQPLKPRGSLFPKYRYPSAGSLYPVQTYVYVKTGWVTGVPGGFYYYHPGTHRLIQLAPACDAEVLHHNGSNQPLFDSAAFCLFLMGDLDAVEPSYGALARNFCLLEAGYIGQLLMATAPLHRLGLCPIGQCDFDALRRLGHLGERHILLHSFTAGLVDLSATLHSPRSAASLTDLSHLRHYLEEHLPTYMVPSAVVPLTALPLTANGKVDRQALPEPGATAAPDHHVAPRTYTEAGVAALFAEVLGHQKVSVLGEFFELGGDSLLAMRLMARVEEKFGVKLSLRHLFSGARVADLAAIIDTLPATVAAPPTSADADANRDEGTL
jgi:amino acid adenylation domain-containing protein